MPVETLNCPNCGAGISSDKTLCEFCNTRLKTVACPSCLGLMFLGNKFCGHCGAHAVEPDIIADDTARKCPRCKIQMKVLEIGETVLRECEKCSGMWADSETFENICTDRERQAAVLGFAGQDRTVAEASSKIRYVACPECGQLMNRNNFAHSSGVIIDVCKPHGIWFDADELPNIIEFIRKGGLEHARQRQIAEIKEERAHLNDELRIQSARDRRFGVGKLLDHDDDEGIRGFLRSLFD